MGAGLLEIDTRPPGAAIGLSSRMESIMIGRMAVFPSGLLVVATLAKAAPVAAIPKERRISPVRFDVIDHRCFDVPSFLQAFLTQPVLRHLQEPLALPLPSSTITTACGGARCFRVELLMFFTVLLTVWDKGWTARVPAGDVDTGRHHISQGRPCFPKCP